MRVAGERYVRFSTQNQIYDDYWMPVHPFGSALLGLSEEETRDVELAHLLLAAAEKVGYQQYERASKLLLRCEWISSARANPAQRVVFHFAEALQERIDKELGRAPMKEFKPYEEIFLGKCTNPSLVRAYEKLPCSQIAVFTGIEAILENVALEPKVLLLDNGIRCGAHWTVLMKALVE
uniref:DELLA protein n=1 Tax=Quercus lobata TaxID=97700 RepID=A0A7N2N3T7_QUELO